MTPTLTPGFHAYEKDQLRELMKKVEARNTNKSPDAIVSLWREEIKNHEDAELLEIDGLSRTGRNLLNSILRAKEINKNIPIKQKTKQEKEIRRKEIEKEVKFKFEARIKFSTWMVPGIGKILPECTGAEVAEIRLLPSRFLTRIASLVAPGVQVKSAFTEDELQKLWKDCQ